VLTPAQRASVRFDERGLVPAIVQDHRRGDVLMLAWMDAAALARTLELGEAVFYSRSRDQQWHKGATSGNTQRVVDLRVDCDGDTLLLLVAPAGDAVACHTGQRSCFHRRLPDGPTGEAPAAPPLATSDAPTAAGSAVSPDRSSHP
jgi:phosphoribosyl-AMP cyclohydrolase